MIEKKVLCPERTRKIRGSFACIEHRFLRDGFFGSLAHHELLLYFFLVLVSDRYGLSYYAYDKICSCLQMPVEDYLEARNALIQKDLIAFDGTVFQVLRLPDAPALRPTTLLKTPEDMEKHDPATVSQILINAFGKKRC
jgi:hypothetical protein